MMLFNNFTLDINYISYGVFGISTCFIVGSIIKNIWFYPSDTQLTLETPTTDTGMDTIRALTSSTAQPSPSTQTIELGLDIGVQTSPVKQYSDVGLQTEVIPENLIDTTSIDLLNLESLSITEKVNNLAWLYPDHPNYITWMSNYSTNAITTNPQLFDCLNLFS